MDNVLETQKAVKDNASTVQDYLKELDSWTQEMNIKDEQLKQAKRNNKAGGLKNNGQISDSNNPGNTSKKLKIEECNTSVKSEKIDANSASKEKIKAHDYASWEKFDADAACDQVEKSASESSESDLSEDEELQQERLKQEAVAEKDRGNEFFKAGKWDLAIEKYTRGMQLDPSNCMLPANRAMALLKKNQFAAAETDCTLALSVDPTYVKAFHRRGKARVGLKKFALALEDFKEASRLEPGDKSVKSEIEKLEEIATLDTSASRHDIKEAKVPPSGKSKFEENMKGALTKATKSPFKGKPSDPDASGKEGRIFPINKPNHLRSTKPLKKIEIVDVESASEYSKCEKEKVVRERGAMASQSNPASKSTGFVKRVESELKTEMTNVAPTVEVVVPDVPKTSTKFISDWKELKTVVNRGKYLRKFKDSDYRTVFKSSLDGNLFSEIVLVVHHLVQRGVEPDIVVHQLRGLSGLPRVSAVSMFMSSQDQKKIKYVIDELECVNKEEKNKWIKTFSL